MKSLKLTFVNVYSQLQIYWHQFANPVASTESHIMPNKNKEYSTIIRTF